MKTNIIIAVLLTTIPVVASAQNYTSIANGNWTLPSRWSNTDGWGTSTPPVNGGHGSGTITMAHNMSLASAYNTGSAVLNINSGKTLTITGNMTVGGGSTVNVSGNLTIIGDLVLNSTINILPGGVVTVNGNVTVNSDNYLIVGTNANPPPYANLVVRDDLKQNNSGDVTLNRNARVAVFGSVTDNGGGGTFLRLNQGAQMYVDKNISYTGGGNDIVNNNSTSPFGLYVNGTTTNTGGGSNTTSNKANKSTMQTTNAAFTSWVNSVSGSLMPVTLLFFEVDDVNHEAIVLTWATASEENFDYFVIESSINGREFSEIGRVTGNGTTNVRHDYSFDVVSPAIGKTYFRLKSVDFDGYTETFKIISATYEAGKTAKIFPNPVVDSIVNIDFNFQADATIVIQDMTGIEVFRQTLNSMTNTLTLPVIPGTYLITVQSVDFKSVSRLQVL